MSAATSVSILAFDMGDDCPYFDRYRLVFLSETEGEWALSVGHTGNHPQGVCMTTEVVSTEPVNGEKAVELSDLPEAVQRAAQNELRLHDDFIANRA